MMDELKRDADYAYEMGKDCAINGANETNCHFSIFSTPENTKAWEKGKREQWDAYFKHSHRRAE